MTDFLVLQLEFTDKAQLENAFALLIDHEGIGSCEVESDSLTARFMATAGIANDMVERIHALGGLRWCSRHAIRRPAAGPV